MLIINIEEINQILQNHIKFYPYTLFSTIMDFLIESSINYQVDQKLRYKRRKNSTAPVLKHRPPIVPLIPSLLEGDRLNKNYTDLYNRNKNAITSYGFILLQRTPTIANKDKLNILLIRRRYSIGFTAFVIGRYSINDMRYLNFLFKNMTDKEKVILQKESFHSLWQRIWFAPESKNCLIRKFENSYEKFITVKNGIHNDNNEFIKLSNLIKNNKSIWKEPDWGLPKGRKDKKETALACAIRELYEETGVTINDFTHLDKIYPLYEKFTGTDGLPYKHVYYVGILNPDVQPKLDTNNKCQMAEVGDICVSSLEEILKLMRTNKRRKIKMFEKLKEIIELKYPEILENAKL